MTLTRSWGPQGVPPRVRWLPPQAAATAAVLCPQPTTTLGTYAPQGGYPPQGQLVAMSAGQHRRRPGTDSPLPACPPPVSPRRSRPASQESPVVIGIVVAAGAARRVGGIMVLNRDGGGQPRCRHAERTGATHRGPHGPTNQPAPSSHGTHVDTDAAAQR